MKVLHLISGGDSGGAKTSVIILLKQLSRIVDVKLVALVEAEFSEAAREAGIDVVIMPQKTRLDLTVIKMLTDMVNQESYDLVNCHGARANFIGAFLKKHIRVPIITTVHSDYVHDFDNSLYKKMIFTTLNWLSLKKMDGYITMAEKLKEDLIHKGFGKKEIFVVYNGVPMEGLTKWLSKEAFLQQYGVEDQKEALYIGTASRLHPIKGIDVLLHAAIGIKAIDSRIKVLIAGNGDEKYVQKYKAFVMEHQLEDTVFFLGFVSEMDAFYQILEVNMITSHSEGLCYALLEGGRFSKASIATRVGGIPELIEHNVNGLLFEDNDVDTLIHHVIDLVQEPIRAKQLGAALYTTIEKGFSDVAMATKYQEIYQKILER